MLALTNALRQASRMHLAAPRIHGARALPGVRRAGPSNIVSRSAAAGATLVVDVERDREQQHEALHGLLPLDADAHDRHAVVEHADDQTTDDRAADGADAALHGRTADECRRDRLELEAVARLR